MEELKFIVPKEKAGFRIDKFLAENLDTVSRSYISLLIDEEKVICNDSFVKSSKKLKENDEILVLFEEPKGLDAIPVKINLDILYEDNDVIVVNKPKGMPVHPANGHLDDTLVNALLYSHKDCLSGINGVLRPGIVHRIDMNTTGSLIVCKNDSAHKYIAKQIETHSINRVYEGIVHGVVKEDEFTIDKPIGRNPQNRLKMAINQNGKRAITQVNIIKRYKDYTYLKFKLYTGRTHQIRVHMQSIGHPLLGDEVYGPKKCPYKLQGQTLHAKTIGFDLPSNGEYIEVEAPLPEYFLRLLNVIKE